jgi:hypothetical protein
LVSGEAASDGDEFLKKQMGLVQGPKYNPRFEAAFENLFNFSRDVASLAFSFGYALGQTVEVPDPEVSEEVDHILDIIRKKRLLPYLPRKKRAGRAAKKNGRTEGGESSNP